MGLLLDGLWDDRGERERLLQLPVAEPLPDPLEGFGANFSAAFHAEQVQASNYYDTTMRPGLVRTVGRLTELTGDRDWLGDDMIETAPSHLLEQRLRDAEPQILDLKKANPDLQTLPELLDEASGETKAKLQLGERSHGVGGVLGMLAAPLLDPVNLVMTAVPVGRATSALMKTLKMAGLWGAARAMQEPGLRETYAKLGLGQRTGGDAVKDVLGAAVTGGVVEGGGLALAKAYRMLRGTHIPISTEADGAADLLESVAGADHTNPAPDVFGTVQAHREALQHATEDLLAGRPVTASVDFEGMRLRNALTEAKVPPPQGLARGAAPGDEHVLAAYRDAVGGGKVKATPELEAAAAALEQRLETSAKGAAESPPVGFTDAEGRHFLNAGEISDAAARRAAARGEDPYDAFQTIRDDQGIEYDFRHDGATGENVLLERLPAENKWREFERVPWADPETGIIDHEELADLVGKMEVRSNVWAGRKGTPEAWDAGIEEAQLVEGGGVAAERSVAPSVEDAARAARIQELDAAIAQQERIRSGPDHGPAEEADLRATVDELRAERRQLVEAAPGPARGAARDEASSSPARERPGRTENDVWAQEAARAEAGGWRVDDLAGVRPNADEVRRARVKELLERDPDREVSTGLFDERGRPVKKRLRELFDDVDREETALRSIVECVLGGGKG